MDEEILEAFREQLSEVRTCVEKLLSERNTSPSSNVVYDAARVVHRLKGDAEFLQLDNYYSIAKEMMAPLEAHSSGTEVLTEWGYELLANCLNNLKDLQVEGKR